TINNADKTAFAAALGDIFERAPWVADAAHAARPFPTLASLYATMTASVRSADARRRLALIKGHPDLAGQAARAGALTPDSTAEQASAGLDRLSDEEFATFHRLNAAYREKFGIPFIICVRRHCKDSILRQFERRLQHAAAAELETALNEIFRIVALRLAERVSATDQLKVHGRLSTHVLDTHSGRPAAGVSIELFEIFNGGEIRLLERATTNEDGRTDRPLIEGRPVPVGRYELRFAVGEYFAPQTLLLADPPFLDIVPVQFAIADPEGHYHVPLLVTPWSYTTYRGS
ncbi:MAG: 2-oxo-4-hydroxy-4-carboxy-5-ureidoimidazoline decarboxylase, partial [Sphingomicrobium sp.]